MTQAGRNLQHYPWFKFFQGLIFWQAVWFLFFQARLSAAEAILIYAIYDVSTTALEVPSGYMSDRLGRRGTLIASAIAGMISALLQFFGGSFEIYALAQVFLGASAAFASGTDSALLYESLSSEGREDEIEAQELKAWRFSFSALAISAVLGGVLALYLDTLPFLASAMAFGVTVVIATKFKEPTRSKIFAEGAELIRLRSLKAALVEPVLVWIFVLSLLMYGFSHLPFVFGQPFIFAALEAVGLENNAPIVSGLVTAVMMIVSVVVSLFALRLRNWIGLPAILLLAFGMQIGLIATLAVTPSGLAIAVLFLRMVPNSISQPFISARIQPMLRDDIRATYLSLQSFCGRLIFAGSLFVAAGSTTDAGRMAYSEISQILGWYAIAGLVFVIGLAFAARRLPIEVD